MTETIKIDKSTEFGRALPPSLRPQVGLVSVHMVERNRDFERMKGSKSSYFDASIADGRKESIYSLANFDPIVEPARQSTRLVGELSPLQLADDKRYAKQRSQDGQGIRDRFGSGMFGESEVARRTIDPETGQAYDLKFFGTKEKSEADGNSIMGLRTYLMKSLEEGGRYQGIAESLGIKDVTHLTPREAILLANQIVVDNTSYDHRATKTTTVPDPTNKTQSLEVYFRNRADDMTAYDILKNADQRDEKGNIRPLGVCRNFAQTEEQVFRAIKMLQDPKATLLNDVECATVTDVAERYGATMLGNIDGGHQWNMYSTKDKDGNYHTVIVDPTWGNGKHKDGNIYSEDQRFEPILLDHIKARIQKNDPSFDMKKTELSAEDIGKGNFSQDALQKIVVYYYKIIKDKQKDMDRLNGSTDRVDMQVRQQASFMRDYFMQSILPVVANLDMKSPAQKRFTKEFLDMASQGFRDNIDRYSEIASQGKPTRLRSDIRDNMGVIMRKLYYETTGEFHGPEGRKVLVDVMGRWATRWDQGAHFNRDVALRG
jgi:hypothetical protein